VLAFQNTILLLLRELSATVGEQTRICYGAVIGPSFDHRFLLPRLRGRTE
jgi:hypothetical protein